MWAIDNKTPFAVTGAFKRDLTGAEVWIVIIRASFDILPDGTTRYAEKQPEPLHAPEYNFEPGVSSLKYDADVILDKPATDVILNGHAHAPKGKAATKLEVGMSLKGINKKLIVTGDRIWRKDTIGSKSLTTPFMKMPLVYERAFGGTDTKHKNKKKHDRDLKNPTGTGFAVKSSNLRNQNVANIQYKRFTKKPNPAGFGAISCHWQPRASYAGTYDKKWEKTQRPLLPKDFDLKYYQYAPEDQQIMGYLRGGEEVNLKNLHPDSNFSFKLPEQQIECLTLLAGSNIKHKSNLHTVIIEPDDNKLIMVWHTALKCHKKEHLLKKTIVRL